MTDDASTPGPVGSPVDKGVGRLLAEGTTGGAQLRPVCWWCSRPIHQLDDMHHLWCHGGER